MKPTAVRSRRQPPEANSKRPHPRKKQPGEEEARVYDAIHAAIVDGRLLPGTKLKELELTELFGVSRALVRQVLARLGHGELVELRPNRGAMVMRPSALQTRELFDARRAIEGVIVESLARRITRGHARTLRAWLKDERAAYAAGDQERALFLSVGFHRLLAQLAGNSILEKFLNEILARTPLSVLTHAPAEPSKLTGCEEHRSIVDAIAAGNASRAATLMRAHVDHLQGQLDFDRPNGVSPLGRALAPR